MKKLLQLFSLSTMVSISGVASILLISSASVSYADHGEITNSQTTLTPSQVRLENDAKSKGYSSYAAMKADREKDNGSKDAKYFESIRNAQKKLETEEKKQEEEKREVDAKKAGYKSYAEMQANIRKKAEDKKKAEKRKRVADAKRAEEKKKAEKRKRVADVKKAEAAKRIAAAKQAEAVKRIADAKKIKEQKIADEKLKIALSLIPPQTKLQNAQNFINDIAKFVERYPNEFDIMDIAMFKINTKLIAEGVLNDVQMNHFYTFEKLVETSSAFKKFQKMKANERNQLASKRITRLIESIKDRVNYLKKEIYTDLTSTSLINKTIKSAQYILDNPDSFSALQVLDDDLAKLTKDLKTEKSKNTKIRYALLNLDKRTSKLKTYLSENLSSISTELMTSIVEKVNLIEGTKKQAFTNKNEELKALKKVNDEIASFILNNNLVTTADISATKKAETDKKKAETDKKKAAEKKKVADAKRKSDDKERARLKNFKTVSMSCSYSINNRYYSYDWAYDGKKLYFGGIPIYIGNNKAQGMSVTVRKLSGRDQFNIRVDVSSLASEYNLGIASANMNFFYDFKNDFYNETSEMTDDGMKGFGNCY